MKFLLHVFIYNHPSSHTPTHKHTHLSTGRIFGNFILIKNSLVTAKVLSRSDARSYICAYKYNTYIYAYGFG